MCGTLPRVSEIGQMIQERRRALGWSQTALAERAGVSRRTIARLERADELRAGYPVLESLGWALGLSPAQMLEPQTPSSEEFLGALAADRYLGPQAKHLVGSLWQRAREDPAGVDVLAHGLLAQLERQRSWRDRQR